MTDQEFAEALEDLRVRLGDGPIDPRPDVP